MYATDLERYAKDNKNTLLFVTCLYLLQNLPFPDSAAAATAAATVADATTSEDNAHDVASESYIRRPPTQA